MKPGHRFCRSELSNDSPAVHDVPADFLGHLQERLGLDGPDAAETLQDWLSTYQPGPMALQRASGGPEWGETVAA